MQFLEKYPKINFEQTTRAIQARNRFGFEEVKSLKNYDALLDFWTNNQKDIKEFSQELIPEVESAALATYFDQRDSTSLASILQLLKTFPALASPLDQKLSRAVEAKPYISLIERHLETIDKTKIPETVKSIYHYYALEGSLTDLLQFNSNYPQYLDSFSYRTDLAIAKSLYLT